MGGAEPLLKASSEAIGELDGGRVGEHGVSTAGFGGAVVEVPQHRLRHRVEGIGRNDLAYLPMRRARAVTVGRVASSSRDSSIARRSSSFRNEAVTA